MVFSIVTLCSLVEAANISEEYTAPIVRAPSTLKEEGDWFV
jgi:hypothetical protein